jgi:hypothetical protein
MARIINELKKLPNPLAQKDEYAAKLCSQIVKAAGGANPGDKGIRRGSLKAWITRDNYIGFVTRVEDNNVYINSAIEIDDNLVVWVKIQIADHYERVGEMITVELQPALSYKKMFLVITESALALEKNLRPAAIRVKELLGYADRLGDLIAKAAGGHHCAHPKADPLRPILNDQYGPRDLEFILCLDKKDPDSWQAFNAIIEFDEDISIKARIRFQGYYHQLGEKIVTLASHLPYKDMMHLVSGASKELGNELRPKAMLRMIEDAAMEFEKELRPEARRLETLQKYRDDILSSSVPLDDNLLEDKARIVIEACEKNQKKQVYMRMAPQSYFEEKKRHSIGINYGLDETDDFCLCYWFDGWVDGSEQRITPAQIEEFFYTFISYLRRVTQDKIEVITLPKIESRYAQEST